MKTLIKLILLTPVVFATTTSMAQFSAPDGNNEIHYSAGNVGVGISNPAAFFHLYQNSSSTGSASGMTVEQAGSGDPIVQFLVTGARRWQIGADNSDGDFFKISEGSALGTNDHLTIDTNGLVGIGTTSPSYKLTINANDDKHLRFENGSEIGLMQLLADGTFNIWSHGSDDITFSNGSGSGTESMRINSVGKVGIGVSSPTYRLDVSGAISGTSYRINGDYLATSWDRRLQIGSNVVPSDGEGVEIGYDSTLNNGIILSYDRANGAYANMYYNSQSHIFQVSGSSKLILDANGNVGIGTLTPDATLAVNGTIHAKSFQADVNGWPDYVFSQNYALRSLESTDAYIQANHHLPDIPAAAQVESNGIDLAEMNKLLLQKVEEMTLHMIQMNKQINQMQDQINSQTK